MENKHDNDYLQWEPKEPEMFQSDSDKWQQLKAMKVFFL